MKLKPNNYRLTNNEHETDEQGGTLNTLVSDDMTRMIVARCYTLRLCCLLGSFLANQRLVDVGDDTCTKIKGQLNTSRHS